MSAEPARSHLRLVRVDDDTGEVQPVDSPALEAMEAELERARVDFKMAKRDVAAKNRRIAELERDRARERLDHLDREFIVRVCTYWHRKCRTKDYEGRRRINPISPERFDAVARLAEMQELRVVDGKRTRCWVYPAEWFKAAIDGGAFDPFIPPKTKNGKRQPQNDLEQLMRSVKAFEYNIEKAPNVTGTFRDDDIVVPPVPGFVRPSPAELKRLARAREARNNELGFQAPGPTQAGIGGSYGSTVGSADARDGRGVDRPGLHVPVRVGTGAPAP